MQNLLLLGGFQEFQAPLGAEPLDKFLYTPLYPRDRIELPILKSILAMFMFIRKSGL